MCTSRGLTIDVKHSWQCKIGYDYINKIDNKFVLIMKLTEIISGALLGFDEIEMLATAEIPCAPLNTAQL
jgi:hypothetical protein